MRKKPLVVIVGRNYADPRPARVKAMLEDRYGANAPRVETVVSTADWAKLVGGASGADWSGGMPKAVVVFNDWIAEERTENIFIGRPPQHSVPGYRSPKQTYAKTALFAERLTAMASDAYKGRVQAFDMFADADPVPQSLVDGLDAALGPLVKPGGRGPRSEGKRSR